MHRIYIPAQTSLCPLICVFHLLECTFSCFPLSWHCHHFHSHQRRSQSALKEDSAGWAERVCFFFFFWLRVSVWMSGSVFLLGFIGRLDYSEAVTLAASISSSHHFTQNFTLCLRLHLQRERDRAFFYLFIFFPAVCLSQTANELCSAVLCAGSSSRLDWCLGSKACSNMSVVQLPHLLFCTSGVWQDPPPRLFPVLPHD